MTKTILITGASAGLGRAIAQKFAAGKWNVIATMRSPEKETELNQLDNVLVTRLDVKDTTGITKAIEAGIAKFGRIDTLINNAGFGVLGAFELSTSAQMHEQFEVNVFGVMNTIKAILPHFRDNKAGTIINISSQGGRVTFPICSLYHASKFAIEGFTESIAYELTPQNIVVKLVEPGSIATGFETSASFTGNNDITAYNDFVHEFLGVWQRENPNPSSPELIADVVFTAATDGTKQLRYAAGRDTEEVFRVRDNNTEEEYIEYMNARFAPKMA
jgi:NAD(P)-dependent dehydrogenase (short-subunit alcohol dehydrogenase family)